MRLYAGYAHTMFDQRTLKRTASHLAEVLPFLMERSNATAIAVRGKSGIALAFAVSAVANENIPIVVCRKHTERSHGDDLEGNNIETEGLRYLILDDFVSSGETVNGIMDDLGAHGAVCVGVVEYATNSGRIVRHDAGVSQPIINGMETIPVLRRELAERATRIAEEAGE